MSVDSITVIHRPQLCRAKQNTRSQISETDNVALVKAVRRVAFKGHIRLFQRFDLRVFVITFILNSANQYSHSQTHPPCAPPLYRLSSPRAALPPSTPPPNPTCRDTCIKRAWETGLPSGRRPRLPPPRPSSQAQITGFFFAMHGNTVISMNCENCTSVLYCLSHK